MKAPNKIYVGFLFDIDFAISHAGCERIREDDKEYISKDAILEWANKQLLSLRNGAFTDQICASELEEVIEKIDNF